VGLELGIGVGLSLLEIIRLMVVMDDRGNRSVQQRKKIYICKFDNKLILQRKVCAND